MLQIILLASSFFCVSNIQAAQESKAVAEKRSEVAIPTAASPASVIKHATPHAQGVKPWQTFAHSKLPAPLWPIIFGYGIEARNQWTIIKEAHGRPMFLSKDKRSLYINIDGLLKYDIDTGALQSQSPINGIKPAKRSGDARPPELFPMIGDRVIVDTGCRDDIRSVDTRSIPKESREHHVLSKRFRSLCACNGYLVTPNDQSALDMRDPKTLEPLADKFFQCKPGPKERDFQFLYSVADRFLFAIYRNNLGGSTMEVFDTTASQTSIYSLPVPMDYSDRPESIERISTHRFAVMACFRKVLKILNTKKKNVMEISMSDEIISSFARFGKNQLLTGGIRGTIALWGLTNPPLKKEMVQPNNCGKRIMSFVRLNNNEFLSLDHDQCIKLWNAKKGTCILQLHNKGNVVYKCISLSDGYIISDDDGVHRVQIKNELQLAYNTESESYSNEPRKAELEQPARAKKAASASRPPSPPPSTPQRRQSLSPAQPAAAVCSASAAAGIPAAIKKA